MGYNLERTCRAVDPSTEASSQVPEEANDLPHPTVQIRLIPQPGGLGSGLVFSLLARGWISGAERVSRVKQGHNLP